MHVCVVGFGRNGQLVCWLLLAPEEIMKTSFGKESAYQRDRILVSFPVAGPDPSFLSVSVQELDACLHLCCVCSVFALSRCNLAFFVIERDGS